MTFAKIFPAAAFAFLITGGAAAQAGSLQNATQAEPSPEACLRTIKTMGASMGYSAMPAEKPTFLFILRVNGVDYNAVCDATTGSVKDVTPKASH